MQAWVTRAMVSDKVPQVGPRPWRALYRKVPNPSSLCPLLDLQLFMHLQISATTCTRAQLLQSLPTLRNPTDSSPQAPLSMGFSRQEPWSGLTFLSPGDLSDPRIEALSPAWQAASLPLSHLGSPL